MAASDRFLLSSDVENEKIVLVGALRDGNMYSLFSGIEIKDFLKSEHQCIALALQAMEGPGSLDLLLAHCKKTDRSVPEVTYLQELYVHPLPSEKEYRKHLQILKDDSRRRTIEDELLPSLIENLATKSKPLSEISSIARRIGDVVDSATGRLFVQSTEQWFQGEYAKVEESRRNAKSYYSCGFSSLDDDLSRGFFPGGITVIGGRPGMGKSSFIINGMSRLSNGVQYGGRSYRVPVLGFSLEMSGVSVLDRMICREARVPLSKLIKGFSQFTPSELERYVFAKQKLIQNKNLYLCDKTGVSLIWIRDQVKRFQDQFKVEYVTVFIDLFGKIADLREEGLTQSYEKQLNLIQGYARELGVHFVLAAQIGRRGELGGDKKRPKLHDIKNSGAWEEVADIVFFLYRPKYYNKDLPDDVLEVNIAKQRDGEANKTKKFSFFGELSLIVDLGFSATGERNEHSRRILTNASTIASGQSPFRRRSLVEGSGSSEVRKEG